MTYFADLPKKKMILELMNGVCGKCKTQQNLEVRHIGKETTYYCPKCKDQISPKICHAQFPNRALKESKR